MHIQYTTRYLILVIAIGLFAARAVALPGADNSHRVAPPRADLVVVIKSARMLYLYAGGTVVGQYPMALGLAPLGDKHQRGDNKTPIGAYTLDWRNPNSIFHRSIHISYPDARDAARAAASGIKPGKNIMIHGQPDYDNRPRTGDWTHGCIAVSNAAMDDIWVRVADGTPIQIYP